MSSSPSYDVSTGPSLDAAPDPTQPPPMDGLRGRLHRLAGPIIAEQVLQLSLDLANTALVAGLGAAALAAVGASLQVMFIVLSSLAALSVGCSILVAHTIGAGDTHRASQLARQALVWSGILALPFVAIGIVGAPVIVAGFGLDAEAAPLAISYLRITMGTAGVIVGLDVLGGALRGAGDSKTPMVATLVAAVLNVPLAWALIEGRGPFPELGVSGAAWATFVSRGVGLCLLVAALWQGRRGMTIAGRQGWRPRRELISEVLRLGIPAAGEQLLISTAWLAVTMMISHVGTDELAVHRVVNQLMSMAFLVGFGVQIAHTSMLGRALGAGDVPRAMTITRMATRDGVALVCIVAVALWVFAEPIVRLFLDDPALVDLGVRTMHVMVFTQPFWAIAIQQSGAMRGMRDTVSPLVIEGVSNWTAAGLIAIVLFGFGGHLTAAWACYVVVGPFLAGAMLLARRRRERLYLASVRPAAVIAV